jgi:hypothetical protein
MSYVDFVRDQFVLSDSPTLASRPRKWWRGEGGTGVWWGDLMGRRLLAVLFETLLAIDTYEFPLTYN